MSNTRIYAFDSPNFPPLLEAKTTLEVDPKMLIHPPFTVPDECRLHDKLAQKVYVLKVAPTITPEIIRAVFEGMEGKIVTNFFCCTHFTLNVAFIVMDQTDRMLKVLKLVCRILKIIALVR